MSETPSLKRDNTMAVTAQEGEAFLQSQGMAVSGDDVKTRAQKEKLEEIENENTPKITRSGTMAVTAEEGAQLLDGCGDLEKTRGQTAVAKETEEASKATTSPCKPAVIRDNTMVTTAQEGAALLEGQKLEKTRGQTAASKDVPASPTTPTKVKRSTTISQTAEASSHILGSEERGRTRSQTRRMSEKEHPEEEDVTKATKRSSSSTASAQAHKEGDVTPAKKAKIDENGSTKETTSATTPATITEAEA